MNKPWRGNTLVVALTLAVACPGVACGPPRGGNVILISIDTLRPDHLGAYGYERPTSPAFDRLRADAILFESAIAHAPSTLASHTSLLTGLMPQHHGASFDKGLGLAAETLTLSEFLTQRGFATASFNGGGQLDAAFGLDRGFDVYETPQHENFDVIVDHAIEWLRGRGDTPFFLFLHTYQVHHPYEPAPADLERFETRYAGSLPDAISVEVLKAINQQEIAIGANDLDHVIAAYDAEILAMDRALGRLIDYLKLGDLYAETVIVFTSDHGEEFGEHGWIGWHSHTLYDELLRVPLVIKLAGSERAGTSVSQQVRGIDIAPTIVAALGFEPPVAFQGVDLRRPDLDSIAPLPAVSWLDYAWDRPDQEMFSIRAFPWKLWRGRLYDLEEDPAERHDVASENLPATALLEQTLFQMLQAGPSPRGNVRLGKAEIERLRALGYLR